MRVAFALVAVLCACSSDDAPYDYAHSKGAAIYQDTCQVCHGETGEGGLGPKLRDIDKSTDELAATISQRMPANAPGQCSGDCATETAQFIHDGLTSKALACPAQVPLPRRLRLLTRREYRATVRDVFGAAAPAMACARATDCAYRDTCTASGCEPTGCDAQTFVYDPHGAQLASVHVAGDFNHWPQTIAGGGLALAKDGNGLWVGTFAIGAGHHLYKLVVNESQWIADPRAPASAADGFGGQNSIVDLMCPGAPVASGDPTTEFPVETRRAGFPFDTDADAALVTSAHVDAYLAAAEQLADFAAPQAPAAADIGRKLFRRPLTTDEANRYSALAATGGAATMLHAMLVSPAFLYRSELGVERDGHYRLTGFEIATALSYNFLGTTPSDELLAAAEHGELDDATGLERWARMLLADPRARLQVGEYVAQWTGAQNVLAADKRADLFPDFDGTRASLLAETRDFAASVVFDDGGTFADLVTANYTVLDATAAAFYGVSPGRVSYDGRRAGVLGHAAVLASAAHSDQTSPIVRGLLIRRTFLCEDLPPPPPNGGGLPNVDPSATTRERFMMHSASGSCRGCHTYIDGAGFGLERFDPVGRWRDSENGMPIDPSGDMNDVERLGTDTSAPYASLPELAQTIATSHAAQSCFVRQYLRFSRGLRETLAERCGRLWLEDKLAAANGKLVELMVQSVLDPDFVERRQP